MVDEEVVGRVGGIAETLRGAREENERLGRLVPEVVEALRGIGVTRLFAPWHLGGGEVDPVTASRVTEALARLDPAAAWFVMVANASRLLASRFPEALFNTIWGDDIDTIMAASGNRPFSAVAVDGGFVLNGTNGFVSGCHHASWLLSPFVCDGHVRFAVMPMDAVTIVDNWHVLGMRGSGSNDVQVTDLFVPELMTAGAEGQRPGRHHQGDLYRCPGRVAFATYVPVALALAETALDEVTELAAASQPSGGSVSLHERPTAQIRFGRALGGWRAARLYYYAAMEDVWQRTRAGHVFSDGEKADLYLAGTHAVQASADAGRLLADIAATSAMYNSSPLQRVFRDLEVLRHHGFVNESRFGNVAQVKWGAPLDYPLLLR